MRRLADAPLVFVFATLAALLLATLPAGAQTGRSNIAASPSPSVCTVTETSRAPLLVEGGREMYIEPTAVLPSRGGVFLAGIPNYLWARGGRGDVREVVRDSVFGAVLGADGRARLVPAPIDPTRVIDVRGVALDGGGWAVTFGELKSPWRPPARDTLVRYWYGVFDGASWSTLEQLPPPSVGELTATGASRVLVRGDTTFFATRIITSDKWIGVAVFERRLGKWKVTPVVTNGGAAVQLIHSDSAGLQLAVVRAAPPPDGGRDNNSLFLHTGKGSWMTSRRIMQGHPEPVYELSFDDSAEGPVFTWWVIGAVRGRQARASVGSFEPGRDAFPLDPSISTVVHIARSRERPLWLLEHVGSDTPELRFVALGADGEPTVLRAMPSPFTGPFGAAATGSNEVIVSGPLLRKESPNPSLVTLLIRARVECAGRAP